MSKLETANVLTIEKVLESNERVDWLNQMGFSWRSSDEDLGKFREMVPTFPLPRGLRKVLEAFEEYGRLKTHQMAALQAYGFADPPELHMIRTYLSQAALTIDRLGLTPTLPVPLPQEGKIVRAIGGGTDFTPTEIIIICSIPDQEKDAVTYEEIGAVLAANTPAESAHIARTNVSRIDSHLPKDAILRKVRVKNRTYLYWERA